MNKSTVAGAALLLAAALAMPLSAWSAGEAPPPPSPPSQPTPPSPPTPPPAHAGPAAPGMPGWRDQHGGPMMAAHGWGPQMMMRRHMTMRWQTPRQRCERRLARHAAHAAYIASLLDLTQQQRPLYDQVRAAMDAAAAKQHQLCATLKPADQRGEETVLDRLDRRERVLEAHLQGLQQVQPALQALYQTLTPAQKAIIDHPFHRG